MSNNNSTKMLYIIQGAIVNNLPEESEQVAGHENKTFSNITRWSVKTTQKQTTCLILGDVCMKPRSERGTQEVNADRKWLNYNRKYTISRKAKPGNVALNLFCICQSSPITLQMYTCMQLGCIGGFSWGPLYPI